MNLCCLVNPVGHLYGERICQKCLAADDKIHLKATWLNFVHINAIFTSQKDQ